MNTADLAVIAVTVLGLANIARDYRVQMRQVDRMRLVNPVKPPAERKRDTEADAPKAPAGDAESAFDLALRRPA